MDIWHHWFFACNILWGENRNSNQPVHGYATGVDCFLYLVLQSAQYVWAYNIVKQNQQSTCVSTVTSCFVWQHIPGLCNVPRMWWDAPAMICPMTWKCALGLGLPQVDYFILFFLVMCPRAMWRCYFFACHVVGFSHNEGKTKITIHLCICWGVIKVDCFKFLFSLLPRDVHQGAMIWAPLASFWFCWFCPNFCFVIGKNNNNQPVHGASSS